MCMSGSFVCISGLLCAFMDLFLVCVCGGSYYTVFTQYVSSTDVSSVAL